MALPRPEPWTLRSRTLDLTAAPLVMGIVNVTPDSFSDGGQFHQREAAVRHALQLVVDGAAVLDIGGESTRPGAEPVSANEELERVVPVIEALASETDCPISIDTSKAAVARAAVDAGAEIINDVTGLEGDPDMIAVARSTGVGVCAMHMQGTPQTMQNAPLYDDVVEEIAAYLEQRRDALRHSGIAAEKICLDPGIGFGKTHRHNIELIQHADRFLALGHPILVGHSRKGFIGKISGDDAPQRLAGTLAVSLYLARKGISVLRVHDVRETVIGLRMQRELLSGSE